MVSHQVHRDTRRTARAARGPLVALSPRVRGLAKLLVLIALLVAAALAVRASPARGWLTPRGIEQLLAALREPWWAPLAFVAAYTIAAALDFSGLVLTLVGGAVFGFWWGALLNLLGANLGASAAFWVARLLGREGLHALLGDRLSGGLDRLAHQAGFAWLLRLRLIPIVPFNLLNFASGLTALPWRTYAAATAIGVIPATLVYTFFADALLSGSREATLAVAERAAARTLVGPAGRARQLNAGAAAARGEWLLFLHADARVPPAARRALLAAVVDAPVPQVAVFRFAIDLPAPWKRFIELGQALRQRLYHLPYGDQGLLIRRELFHATGGYADIEIMEDVEMIRRMKRRRVEIRALSGALVTSGRRYRERGVLRTWLTNVMLIALYLPGVPPRRLARWRAA